MRPANLEAPTIREGAPAAAPPPGVLSPGSELAGRYRILELLGEGGMGVVYRARDRSLDIDVALKRLHPRIAHDAERVAFFRNEVRVARMVTHPNVCRLHDLVEDPGGCFITMELVAGEPLSARLARGRLSLPDALGVLRDVARGLAAAHAAGVIHRDLKPSNVLLARDRAVVADFGIAGEGHALAASPQDVAGTRGYMAPEQVTGAPVDARVDVYALGVLGFVLTTGHQPPPAVSHPPPPADNQPPSPVDRQPPPLAADRPPPPSPPPARRPPPPDHPPPPIAAPHPATSPTALPIGNLESQLAALPAALAAVLSACLAVDPADRPRDAGDVVRRLDAVTLPASQRPVRRTHRRTLAIALGVLAALALAAAATVLFRHSSNRGPVAPRFALPALDSTALPEADRWLAAVVQRQIADELVDAWGLDVELDAPAHPAPGTRAIAARMARDASGRLRVLLDGDVVEAATPRELALAAAARIVTRHVPPAARHPTRFDLASVGAHDAEAWRLWRRAQHETLLARGERARALLAEARTRDPEFPLPVLEDAMIFDKNDAAADRELAEAERMMTRVAVRPIWRMAATVARQRVTNDAAGAMRTVAAARRLDLTPRERLWMELRWAMVLVSDEATPDAIAALELVAERNPSHPAAFKLLASVQLGSDSPAAPTLALRYASRAVELAPEDAGARADLAVALLGVGRRDDARARAAELARLDPDDKRLARSRLFTLHMALGDVAEAEVDVRRQLTGSPGQRAEGGSGLAMIDLYRGRFEPGLAALIAAADAFDALGMTVSAARTRFLAGRLARQLGDRATALTAFERIAAGPTHYAGSSRVLARVISDDLDAARAAAAAITGSTVERAAADLAIADAAHDTAGVIAAFARIEPLSTTIEHLYAVGDALERRGRIDEAVAVFERLAGHPHAWSEPIASTRAWHRLGLLRDRAGDAAGARAAFAEVLSRWGAATTPMPEVDEARRRLKAARPAPR